LFVASLQSISSDLYICCLRQIKTIKNDILPSMIMRKVYTKRGDEGFTNDYTGKKIPKDSPLIFTLGKLDSLQASIDKVLLKSKLKEKKMLDWIQVKLWQTAGELACADKSKLIDVVSGEDLELLEKYTDSYGEPPKKFVRFDTEKAVDLNECRIRCRELELHIVPLLREGNITPVAYKWLNRLSSLFFIMAYKASKN
jgi:cob(I)alamin adenosyltransferase